MAKTSTTQITVLTSGDGVTSRNEPAPLSNSTSPSGGPVAVALAAGDNTVLVPSGARGLVLIPPVGSTNAKKLKGVGGDTGFSLRPDEASLLALPAATASIIVNSVAIEVVQVHWV